MSKSIKIKLTLNLFGQNKFFESASREGALSPLGDGVYILHLNSLQLAIVIILDTRRSLSAHLVFSYFFNFL